MSISVVLTLTLAVPVGARLGSERELVFADTPLRLLRKVARPVAADRADEGSSLAC